VRELPPEDHIGEGEPILFCAVRLRSLFGLLYQPQMIDDDCGPIVGMRIGRGNRITRKKPAPVPLCPPQIPRDLTRARTRAAAVRSRRLTKANLTPDDEELDR
jgi:hypothetical protein